MKTTKLNDLKSRKKQLKKDCDKLEREKEKLMEHLVKMMSESRMTYNFTPCSHAVQQHNVRNDIFFKNEHSLILLIYQK